MIRFVSVSKTYSQKGQTFNAIDDLSLTIDDNEAHGIIGESGAGKSTLLRMINLLVKPSSGDIFIDGEEISKRQGRSLNAIRRQIGMIFQHFNLIKNKTVLENVCLPFYIHQKPIDLSACKEMLNFVGLSDKLHHYPNELSGGQKQRLAIARALMTKPKILLCDEPTSALDPKQSEAILNLLNQVKEEFNMTLVVIAHQMSVIKSLCQKISVMDKGKLISTHDLDTLITTPNVQNQFIQNLKPELPSYLKNKIQTNATSGKNPLVRIIFSGDIANRPILSELSQNLDIKFNLLQANIDAFGQKTYGIANIELILNGQSFESVEKSLSQQGLHVENLGYV